jgi:hypothetical protein
MLSLCGDETSYHAVTLIIDFKTKGDITVRKGSNVYKSDSDVQFGSILAKVQGPHTGCTDYNSLPASAQTFF